MFVNVNIAVILPVNVLALVDDTDFKTIETAVAYNAAGMALQWNFETPAGVLTHVDVTPTTSGVYDWQNMGRGMYGIEMPASGGASVNNDTVGAGWFTGSATGVLAWRGPVIIFRLAAINDALLAGTEFLPVDAYKPKFDVTAGVLTVKKPDDTTTAHTKTVTSDPAASPIIGAS